MDRVLGSSWSPGGFAAQSGFLHSQSLSTLWEQGPQPQRGCRGAPGGVS